MSSILVAPPLSRQTIEKYAEYVRKQIGIDSYLCLPVVKVAELIVPQFDKTFEFDVVERYELQGEYATYSPNENKMRVREDVYLDACNGDARHRFTIAHELGHYFIHDDMSTFSRCSTNEVIPAFKNPEWQANVFASAILMPPKLIRGMTADEVARKCKTSFTSAKIALENIAKKG